MLRTSDHLILDLFSSGDCWRNVAGQSLRTLVASCVGRGHLAEDKRDLVTEEGAGVIETGGQGFDGCLVTNIPQSKRYLVPNKELIWPGVSFQFAHLSNRDSSVLRRSVFSFSMFCSVLAGTGFTDLYLFPSTLLLFRVNSIGSWACLVRVSLTTSPPMAA